MNGIIRHNYTKSLVPARERIAKKDRAKWKIGNAKFQNRLFS